MDGDCPRPTQGGCLIIAAGFQRLNTLPVTQPPILKALKGNIHSIFTRSQKN